MKLMLDSGAFSAWRKGISIDIDAYANFLKENGHLFDHWVNLDVIKTDSIYDSGEENERRAKQSYMNWMYLRSLGLETMPVYHLGTSEKWLKKYLQKTDYIGVGAIAKASSKKRLLGLERIWRKYLLDASGKPTVKVHGMGMTSLDFLKAFPWYSVDSVTPSLAAGFGGVFLPAIRDDEFDFLNMTPYKVSDQFKHKAVGIGSFSRIGKTLRPKYEAYFEEMGFTLGKIHGVKNRLKKSEAKEPPEGLFEHDKTISDSSNGMTLANNSKLRRKWNLLMWERISKALPLQRTIIYVGGTFDVLKDVLAMEGDLAFLFSYFTVNSNFVPRLKETLKIKS